MRALPWTAPARYSPLALWDRIAAEAGLSLDVDPSLLPNLSDDDRPIPFRNGTAMLLDALQVVGGDACVVLESDALRILPRARAMEFWTAWAEKERP